ncbi:MAG: hypothetical protein FJ145_17095 [Deltaproteobacteria bacterium]|nr:hypothetical protein [Deltaproteobacteria bacterium]
MAKKDLHEELLKRGLDILKQAGVSLENPSAQTISQLKQTFGREAATDLAAAYLLGKIADESALAALRELEGAAASKDTKREIKRALFKLAQKGFKAAEEPAGDSKPAIFERSLEVEAYMSAVDGGGGRLLWVVKPHAGHGLQVIQAMLHDSQGLLRVGGMHMKRKELRSMMDEIKEQHDVSMIAVPWEYADHVLYEGYERAKARGQSGLENFHELRSMIGTGKPKEQQHPIYQRMNAADAREGGWRETSHRLLGEPELRYWILTDAWMQGFLGQIDEARSSRLVLNPMQKEERLSAIVRDAVKQLCSGDNGAGFARRMEDMALYFHETKRPDQAKLALAVALQVKEGDPGPLDVSFLTGLVQKSFAIFMSQEKAKQEEARDSLLIKP